MKGILMMLKALGLDIPPEQIAMLQVLIPQLPAKINEASAAINTSLQNFDARLRALEQGQQAILDRQHSVMSVMHNTDAHVREVLDGNTGRILDTPRPVSSGSNGSGS